ncbi:TPA: DUF3850 domain-containing protein [Enterobacter cloacae]|nr:DUF3850 domain-containing protein [Enterobacter cloacae]
MSTITRESVTHNLKIWPEYYTAVCAGDKRAELRWNDRNYQAGDILDLCEWDPNEEAFTGEFTSVTVTHVAELGQWMPGYVLLSFALASLESEPVGYFYADKPGDWYQLSGGDRVPSHRRIPLYANPQSSPVVKLPNEFISSEGIVVQIEKLMAVLAVHGIQYERKGNACRNSTLQSFGNSEQLNSPVIKDCSEDTKRLDWLDAQNKRLNEYHGTTYGWKFDANFQRNAMMLNDSNYPVMSVRQAIDEAIATAPQQEVK